MVMTDCMSWGDCEIKHFHPGFITLPRNKSLYGLIGLTFKPGRTGKWSKQRSWHGLETKKRGTDEGHSGLKFSFSLDISLSPPVFLLHP